MNTPLGWGWLGPSALASVADTLIADWLLADLGALVERLPTINALLNLTATLLLVAGYGLIRQRRETAHRNAMLAAFVTSTLFLACYLVYHASVGHVPFEGPSGVRRVYLAILASHVVLAALVPVLAITTIVLGLTDRRSAHRRWARVTFPIWLYVSITGVVIYVMLYLLYPPRPADSILPEESAAALPAPPYLPPADVRR